LEGVALALREIFDEFARLDFDLHKLYLTGGGARSALWRQIIVDVLNVPVMHSCGDSTLGDAMVVAVGVGHYSGFAAAADGMVAQRPCEMPSTDAVVAYKRLYEVFTENREAVLNAPRFEARMTA
jgi:sugar (pentulose or hexulose) kinase